MVPRPRYIIEPIFWRKNGLTQAGVKAVSKFEMFRESTFVFQRCIDVQMICIWCRLAPSPRCMDLRFCPKGFWTFWTFWTFWASDEWLTNISHYHPLSKVLRSGSFPNHNYSSLIKNNCAGHFSRFVSTRPDQHPLLFQEIGLEGLGPPKHFLLCSWCTTHAFCNTSPIFRFHYNH